MSNGGIVWNSQAPPPQQTVLAAYVQEGLLQIGQVVDNAKSELEKAPGHDPSFDAYLSGKPSRVHDQVGALYEGVRKVGLTYRLEPWDSRHSRQVIRLAHTVLIGHHGCCIDLVLLLASALSRVKLFPLVVVVGNAVEPTHAVLGYWLEDYAVKGRSGRLTKVLTAADLNRDWGKLEFVECTDLAGKPSKNFDQAQQDALTHLPPNPGCTVWYAVDVHACRENGVEPQELSTFDRLLPHYLNQVVVDCASQDLTCLARNVAAEEHPEALPLAEIYTSLDVLRGVEQGPQGGGRMPVPGVGQDPKRLSVVSFANGNACAAVLGDPGSGKTTFANYLTLCLAGERLGHGRANLSKLGQEWDRGPLLPMRVVLRDFIAQLPAPGPAPVELLWLYIARRLGPGLQAFLPLLQAHWTEHGGILVLDGLDEVPDAQGLRQFVQLVVKGFRLQMPSVRVLATSRTYAYQPPDDKKKRPDTRLAGFEAAALAPFNQQQIESFVDAWYAHAARSRTGRMAESAEGRATLLKRAIAHSSYLKELATRPLLLTLMASLHAWRGGNLPEKREQLYEESVDLLLFAWQRQKQFLDAQGTAQVQDASVEVWFKTPQADIQKALEKLAFDVHRAQALRTGVADIPEPALVTALLEVARKADPNMQPLRVIEYIRDRAGLLNDRGDQIYCFPHRTFQEYLAARHLTNAGFPNLIVDLVQRDVERWREVVLLAGAKVARGAAYTGWVLARNLCPAACGPRSPQEDTPWWLALLAGQLLCETGIGMAENLGSADLLCRADITGWLARLVSEGHLPVSDRAAAGIALGMLGDPRAGVGLKNGLPDIDWIEIAAGAFLMGDERQPANIARAYWISRYPVTVEQYQAFVEAGGYKPAGRRYWTEAGWAWKTSRGIEGPRDFDSVFQTPNHPRVGVSWYEAVAFCRWLGERLKMEVSLPTEAQWERAARHTDGREYPWGDAEEVAQRCNVGETGIGHTSAVGMFPSGNAKCGAADMAGNVWEWCPTKYDPPADDDLDGYEDRVMRGGSWSIDRVNARCAYRHRYTPVLRYDYVGFRVVASPF